jgi:diguanylate cyclase
MTKILIVEDDSLIRHLIKSFLSLENYDVTQAEDGLQGAELATLICPDLIICDVFMPNLDGYGLLEQLATNPLTASIPFIFLTGLPDRTNAQISPLWANCIFLGKPFTRKELLNNVQATLTGMLQKNEAIPA